MSEVVVNILVKLFLAHIIAKIEKSEIYVIN